MINGIMKRFALSREGAKGLVRAVAACTVADIVLMFPVGLRFSKRRCAERSLCAVRRRDRRRAFADILIGILEI